MKLSFLLPVLFITSMLAITLLGVVTSGTP